MATWYKNKKPFHPLLISLVGSVQEYVDVINEIKIEDIQL